MFVAGKVAELSKVLQLRDILNGNQGSKCFPLTWVINNFFML